ncbi:LysR substrate-binding domain-containing protein [Streptomyces lunalinharesii]|uniref:LysR substrate-binding domain-containing protein n=1 Tax=Streptomyces lunalinharesii TaxID=333384 RepID=A0ABP6EFI6_9ACTN
MLDMHRLRILRELKHRGTLAAVAAAMAYAPSSISMQLSQLEEETGVPLLQRVGRSVRLTPQAELLVSHTEALLELMERAEADLAASSHAITGTVRLATFQTVALALLPTALGQLRAEHPQLRVEISQLEPEQALPGLVAHDFDLVIAHEYPGHPLPRLPQIEHQTLVRDRLHIAVPEELADKQLRLADLADRAWVMEQPGTPARRWCEAVCREAGFEPDVRYCSYDLQLHVKLVEAGEAVALLPELVWAGAEPTVAQHGLADPHSSRRIVAATRRGAHGHPAVLAVRQALLRASAARR